MIVQPTTPEEVQLLVKSHPTLRPFGGRTKSALSADVEGVVGLDMSQMRGIIEYQPTEYTFTAYAGTPVQDVAMELEANGQYLPFDPLLVKKGATLGGTVAANAAGSGRYRYGGLRDFIIGLHFVDGRGDLVLGGGKVVKNAAGFDTPKFMVGSLGRFGVFVDLTFKVFPQPRTYATMTVSYATLEAALQAIFCVTKAPFEMDVFDMEPQADGQFDLLIRLGGLADAIPGRVERLQAFLQNETAAQAIAVNENDYTLWDNVTELNWLPSGASLVKVPLTPKRIPPLEARLSAEYLLARRYSVAGNVAWLAVSDLDPLESHLNDLDLVGVQFISNTSNRPYLGPRKGVALLQRVKQALDPDMKFGEF